MNRNMHTTWLGVRLFTVLGLAGCSVSPVLASSIGTEGGQVELKATNLGKVELQALPATFSSKTEVQLSVTQTKETTEDFNSTPVTRPGRLRRLPGEIRVQTGKSKPRSSIKLQLQLPVKLVPSSGTLKVMAQLFYESDTEILDSFDEIDSSFEAATRTLRFELEPSYFTSARGKSGKVEAVVVIVIDSGK